MTKAIRLHPFDIVVALRLLRPPGTLATMADELAVVPSQVHAAQRRLAVSGLLRIEGRGTNPRALSEFLLAGVRYAFPVQRGPLTEGVPTGYSAPPLAGQFDALDALVWPATRHPQAVRGFAITPLYPRAPELLARSPDTYLLLTVVDALRLGEARVRSIARAELERMLAGPSDVS